MSQIKVRFSITVIGLLLLANGGCGGCFFGNAPPRIKAPPINAVTAAQKAVEQYGQDGKIAGADLDKAPSLKSALKRIDVNGDGIITADEIAARIQSWKDSKIVLVLLGCVVNRKKGSEVIPLAGATVTFEAEKFMGENYPSAVGTTDHEGNALMVATTRKPNEPMGMHPGFYLVRITMPNQDIPARYNTQTTLGVEVSQSPPMPFGEDKPDESGTYLFTLEY